MPPEFAITPVPQANWPQALALLFAAFPDEELSDRIAATLAAVDAGRLSLDGLMWALHHDAPIAAALAMAQPDGITLVWPPMLAPTHRDEEAVAEAMLSHLTAQLDAAGVKLSQILIDALDECEQARLMRHGYQQQTDLFFLGRPLAEPLPPPSAEPPLSSVTLAECGNRARFAAVLEATYQGTCDCPWMNGLRTAAEALDCHQLSGVHDPGLWRIFKVDGRDAAVCLLSDHPDQDAIELVYFGVVPEFRGQGLGRRVLRAGLQTAVKHGRAAMFLAVDAQNRYANALYAEQGFGELARRRALFRPRFGLARESSTGS